MFLLDGLAVSSMKGLLRIFEIIHWQVEEEMDEGLQIRRELQRLRNMYETNEITHEVFLQQEGELIERLRDVMLQKSEEG